MAGRQRDRPAIDVVAARLYSVEYLNSDIPLSWSLVALTHGASSGYQGLGFDVLADAAPVVVVDVWREEHRLQKPRQ